MNRWRAVWLAAATLAGCGSAGGNGVPPSVEAPPASALAADVAFVDVTLVPMDRERLLEHQTLLVRGDEIVALGPSAELQAPRSARVIDGRGKFLIPGLADMHTHLRFKQELSLYLAMGVTTLRNMWGTPMHLEWREQIGRGKLLAPRLYTAGPIMDGAAPVHDGSLELLDVAAASAAVKRQKLLGYDFLKVYTKLPKPVYERLLKDGHEQGMAVAGHIPRAVGLEGVLAAGQDSIEHLNVFWDALQAGDSPVAGKQDGESRERRLDYLDESKIPALAQAVARHRTWVCPTRDVMRQLEPRADVLARIERPESQLVPAVDRAIWAPWGDETQLERRRNQRALRVADALIAGFAKAGVGLLAGTDLGNPLVVPGYSLHDELELLVKGGLTPYQALRAASAGAAEFLHAEQSFGRIAPRLSADLLLLDANPLDDIAATRKIAGVMLRGQWLDAARREQLVDEARALAQGKLDFFAGSPGLTRGEKPLLVASYDVSWKGALTGREEVVVEQGAAGRVIHTRAIDIHDGQRTWLTLEAGQDGRGARLSLQSDGAAGRGRLELTRDGARASLSGELLSGVPAQRDAALDSAVWIGAKHSIAATLLLAPRLRQLKPGEKLSFTLAELGVGSEFSLRQEHCELKRSAESAVSFDYAIGKHAGKLSVDRDGFAESYAFAAHGASVRFQRRAR